MLELCLRLSSSNINIDINYHQPPTRTTHDGPHSASWAKTMRRSTPVALKGSCDTSGNARELLFVDHITHRGSFVTIFLETGASVDVFSEGTSP